MSDESTARLPAFREQARKGLSFLVSYLLTNSEQQLVAMAGRASSNAEQNLYLDAMRELRQNRSALEEFFMRRVLAGFDSLGAEQPREEARRLLPTAPPKAPSLDIAQLGMVRDELLEETLAIENIASRASHRHRDALLRMAQFIAGELGRRRVDIDAVPIGPQALTRAFMDACGEAEVEPRTKLVFAKLFTRFVIDELDQLYEPCLKLMPKPVEEVDAAPSLGAAARSAASAGAQPESTAKPEAAWDLSRAPLLAPPGRARAMPLNLLDELLAGLQKRLLDRNKPMPALNPKAGLMPLEMFELLSDQLAETGHRQPVALSMDHAENISLVALLFQHAMRDQRIPQPVRRLIRLLQIPLLRAAMRSAEVLHDVGYPLRLLMKEAGGAALGWAPAADGAADPFFRKVQALVARIVSEYDGNEELFTRCLAELRAFLRSADGRARLLGRHPQLASLAKGDADAARAAGAALIAAGSEGMTLPLAATEFLRGLWGDALFATRVVDGADSGPWQLAAETTSRLLAFAGGRAGDAAFAPIAQGLKLGLQKLGLEESAALVELRELEGAIVKALAARRGAPAASAAAEPAVAVAAGASARPPASDEFLQIVDKLAPDTWVEFRLRGKDSQRVRLLTKFPKTGQFVFVNAEGAKFGDWMRADLAAVLQNGEAVVVGAAGANSPSGPGRWGRR